MTDYQEAALETIVRAADGLLLSYRESSASRDALLAAAKAVLARFDELDDPRFRRPLEELLRAAIAKAEEIAS